MFGVYSLCWQPKKMTEKIENRRMGGEKEREREGGRADSFQALFRSEIALTMQPIPAVA
jgi:hypothetical protein